MSERRELTIAYLQNNEIPVINYANRRLNTAAVVIEAGTFDDPPYCSNMAHEMLHTAARVEGLVHAVEHVVCGSSDTHESEDVALDMEELFGGTDGSDINVRTMSSNTAYTNLDMPNRKVCERAFLLHATLVRDAVIECHTPDHPGKTFSLDSVLCERAAVRTEAAWRMQDPYLRVSEGLHYRMFRDTTNPAKMAGTGDVRHMRNLTAETLRSWAARFYVPKRIFLVGAGPTQTEMLDWAAKAGLDQIPPYKGPKPTYRHRDQPVLTDIMELVMEQPGVVQIPSGEWVVVPQHMGLAWPTEAFITEDAAALQVLSRMLKMRVEMKLRDENREFDAGVYHPASTWYATKYHGLLEVWFATPGDQNYVQGAEAAVLDICRKLKDDNSEAMKRQCRAIRKNLAETVEQDWKWYPDRITERIIDHWTNGDRKFIRLYSLRDRLMNVRPQDIRRVANKYLTTDRYVRAQVRSQFIAPEDYAAADPKLQLFLKHFLRPAD